MSPFIEAELEAAVDAGYAHIEDLNVAEPEGVSRFQLTQRNGMRWSSADAFLHPAADRPNLEVRAHVFVERIVFEGDRAVGVELVHDSVRETVRAEREVIVSGGAYQSPVLLMLSGDRAGPGSRILRDPGAPGSAGRREPAGPLHGERELPHRPPWPLRILTPETFALLEAEGRGPLTSNYPEAGGFFTDALGLPAPDVEFHFAAAPFFDQGLTPPPDNGFAFGPVVIQPTSRGKVGLRTPMPESKPTVRCNFLTTPEDRASVLEGVRIALDIASRPALQALQSASR